MNRRTIFNSIFILTILVIRTGVFLFPERKVLVDGTIIHHFWIGLVVVAVAQLLPLSFAKARMILLPVGVAAMADELFYISFGGNTVSEYWSWYSVLGAILSVIVVFAMRERIANKLRGVSKT